MRAILAASFAACAFAACLFPSLDGLTDGGVDASDASNEPDIAVETGADVITQAARFCDDASARFCEDFDEPDAFGNWPIRRMQNGVTFALGASDASPPNAAQFVQVAVGLDGGSPFGAMEHDFTTPKITASGHLAFDFRVDQLPRSAPSFLSSRFNSTLRSGPTSTTASRSRSPGRAACMFECVPTDAGTSTYPGHTLTGHATLGQWTHVDIDMLFAPKDIVVSVAFDGTSVLAPTKLDTRVTYAAPALQLGLVATDPRKLDRLDDRRSHARLEVITRAGSGRRRARCARSWALARRDGRRRSRRDEEPARSAERSMTRKRKRLRRRASGAGAGPRTSTPRSAIGARVSRRGRREALAARDASSVASTRTRTTRENGG